MSGKYSGSVKDLKKKIGHLVVRANSDILDLDVGYKRIKEGGELTKKEKEAEESLIEKKTGLEDAVKSLEGRTGYIREEKLEKFVKMMKTTIETAGKLLERKEETEVLDEAKVKETQAEAKSSVEEIELLEREIEEEKIGLSGNLSRLCGTAKYETGEVVSEEEDLKRELDGLDGYLQERFKKIRKEICRKMLEQITKLESEV
jgi:hypothetical protein